jgi:hypothetical protein
MDEEVGSMNTIAALSTSVDVLNHLLTIIRTDPTPFLEIEPVSDFTSIMEVNILLRNCSIHFGLKESYDDTIWSGGFYHKSGEQKYVVKFPEQEALILKEIGRYRLQQDCLAVYWNFKNVMQGTLLLGKRTRQNVRIAEAMLSNGHVTYTLGTGFDQSENDDILKTQATIHTYYDFLENLSLPNSPSLKLLDLVAMFGLVQGLYDKVADSIEGHDFQTVEQVKNFSCRIRREELTGYLLARSTYDRSEIEMFLDYLVNPASGRVNFWNHPFYQLGEMLISPIMTVISANLFNLVDRWLEQAGISLNLRGGQLETYLQEELKALFDKKGYFCSISSRKKFKSSTREKEEIDLIINLRDIVVIAEVKCIKYPMEIRDYHNAYERLAEGSNQITRKVAYFEKFRHEFEANTGKTDNKPVVKLIITNYPNFSGSVIDEIPVVDVHWLRMFIKHSQLLSYVTYQKEGQLVNEAELVETLYTDEGEFCRVFGHQMKKPAVIAALMNKMEIREIKMTLQDFPFEIFMESASFKQV